MPSTISLTQKETSLINDLTSQEKICIEKYTQYSSDACDSNLKDIFNTLKGREEQHLTTLNQISQGQIPQVGGTPTSGGQTTPTPKQSTCTPDQKQNDCYLCEDALSTEKHVSSIYNTSVFEFVNPELRQVLNHIQKEEQEHGEVIFNYMKTNNMYSTQ